MFPLDPISITPATIPVRTCRPERRVLRHRQPALHDAVGEPDGSGTPALRHRQPQQTGLQPWPQQLVPDGAAQPVALVLHRQKAADPASAVSPRQQRQRVAQWPRPNARLQAQLAQLLAVTQTEQGSHQARRDGHIALTVRHVPDARIGSRALDDHLGPDHWSGGHRAQPARGGQTAVADLRDLGHDLVPGQDCNLGFARPGSR
jgi:hypothetical protein